MIVAIEGQVGAGKTTLARLLGVGARVEGEYEPVPQAGEGEDHWVVQQHYLACERERSLRLAAQRDLEPPPSVVLDRSVVSQAAHVHAVAVLGLADAREDLARYLRAHRTEVIEPHWFVLLDPPRDTRRTQLAARESSSGRLGTAGLLRHAAYEDEVDRFVRGFLARVGSTRRLETFDPEDAVWARQLLDELERGVGRPPETVPVLVDLLREGLVRQEGRSP